MVELRLFLHQKTGNTIKVSRDGNESKAAWLPLRSVTFRELGDGWAHVTMERAPAELFFGTGLPLYKGK